MLISLGGYDIYLYPAGDNVSDVIKKLSQEFDLILTDYLMSHITGIH